MLAAVGLLVIAVLPLALLVAVRSAQNPIGIALAVYAVLLPFGSGVTLPIGLPAPFNTLSTLVGLWVIVATLIFLARGGQWARLHPSVPVWLALMALVVLSDLWSVDSSLTVSNAEVFISLVVLFLVVSLVGVEAADVRRVEIAAIVGGVAACIYGLWLLQSGRLAATVDAIPRFATAGGVGDAADPNVTAASLLLPAVLALSAALRARNWRSRVLALSAFFVMVTGIILTGSRGGLLAMIVGAAALIASERGLRSLAPAVVIVACIIVGALTLAPSSLGGRFTQTTSTGRTDLWRVGARACPAYCLKGSGWATFPDVYRNTLLTNFDLKGHGVADFKAHDIALAMIVEMGIGGLVLAALGIFLVARSVWQLPRPSRGPPLAALIAVLTANMFLSNFNFKYFWFSLTYCVLVCNAARTQPEPLTTTPAVAAAPASV